MPGLQDHQDLAQYWREQGADHLRRYADRECDFLPFLLPEQAVALPGLEVTELLSARLGAARMGRLLDPQHSETGPRAGDRSPAWLRRTNMVGVNVRTVQSFWNVVKYALTLPAAQDSIHLLPIWEPGVVASLYGMASWQINPEFFSSELLELLPHLDTVEKQLKVVVNLLHAMGKSVGLDVIPHADRYSQIVLANPGHFEWLQRRDLAITDHRADLHEAVEEALFQVLLKLGPAVGDLSLPADSSSFFHGDLSEEERNRLLFGEPHDYQGRNERRGRFVQELYEYGYEPVPATMGPPYRGLEVDPRPEARTVDSEGRIWCDYRITRPQPMSRVFGPLTRYKFYERHDDNRDWQIDFDRPREAVWDYVCEKYAAAVDAYGFDFMRGDMSHVQMRPEGVPAEGGAYYDPHRAIGRHIRGRRPWFGYFAETFLAPAGTMAYGDEVDHLELAEADTTLGDLQSMVVGSPEFLQAFRWYLDIGQTRRVTPSFTLMTGDKDDPRFDRFYLTGNEVRLFLGLFLGGLPSYMGLGFECRDPHPEPAPNEHYSKLYVFRIDSGEKATQGPYRWGQNAELFTRLTRIRLAAEEVLPGLAGDLRWLLPPDPTGHHSLIAWTHGSDPRYAFVANLNPREVVEAAKVPGLRAPLRLHFSTHPESAVAEEPVDNGYQCHLGPIGPGECRVYHSSF